MMGPAMILAVVASLAGATGAGENRRCKGPTRWCRSLRSCVHKLEFQHKCKSPRLRCPDAMARIGGGSYRLGSPAGQGDSDERPEATVRLKTFCLDQTEVTQSAYAAFAKASAHPAPTCAWSPTDTPTHPVSCVSHDDAEAYCAWRQAKLPTEAQWEAAARGKTQRPFPWGAEPPSCARATMAGCADGPTATATHAAGATADEVHDLAGNVWEWVADRYAPSYAARTRRDPTGPAGGPWRVLRGGSFRSLAVGLRAADRDAAPPQTRDVTVGFRCAAPP